MIFLQLYLSFLKIGFTSFGGLSMIPLILEEMQSHNWMSTQDLTNLIAIAEMTPGPLGINCATFAGTKAAGLFGGLAAVAGVLTPAFTLTIVVAACFRHFRSSPVMGGIMKVVKPICIAMILDVIVTLSAEHYLPEGGVNLWGLVIAGVSFYLLRRRKWSVPRVIVNAAVMGVALYGVLPTVMNIT